MQPFGLSFVSLRVLSGQPCDGTTNGVVVIVPSAGAAEDEHLCGALEVIDSHECLSRRRKKVLSDQSRWLVADEQLSVAALDELIRFIKGAS